MQEIRITTETTTEKLPADLIESWSEIFADPASAQPGDLVGVMLRLNDIDNGVDAIFCPQFILRNDKSISLQDADLLDNVDMAKLYGIMGQLVCNENFVRQISDVLEDAASYAPSEGKSQVWIFSDGCLLMPEGAVRLFSPREFTSKTYKKIGDYYRILVSTGDSAHARIEATARSHRLADFYSKYVLKSDIRSKDTPMRMHMKFVPGPIQPAE